MPTEELLREKYVKIEPKDSRIPTKEPTKRGGKRIYTPEEAEQRKKEQKKKWYRSHYVSRKQLL